jgi:hypothetical protein
MRDMWLKFVGVCHWLHEHWRLVAGITLFIATEMLLFGASEGPQKAQWILYGTIPNAALTIGFILPRQRKIIAG